MTRTNASMADKRFIVILRQNELYVEMGPISMIAEWAKIPHCRFGPRSPITHVAEHTDEGTQTRRRSRGAAQRRWRVPSRLIMKATRVRRGAVSLSMASHLPVTLGSYCITPVMLPPGRDRLAMKPEPTGSARAANTIGISWLSRCSAATAGVGIAKI